MATLYLTNTFELTDNAGVSRAGRQGGPSDSATTPHQLTSSTTPAIAGTCHSVSSTLATATWVTVWDEDDDAPADFDYLHIVADQDFYIQLVGSSTNVTLKVAAEVPFTISGFDQLLAAADTSDLSSEPSMEDIDHVRIGNHSGTTMNYTVHVIN